MSKHHPFHHLSHLMPSPSDSPEVAGRKAVNYFKAVESARLAMDANPQSMPNKSGWEDRDMGPSVLQETVSSRSLTLDDEEERLEPELVAAIMSHARQTYDAETCAKLARHFGYDDEEEGVTYGPPNFSGQHKTGGRQNSLSDDALIDELRAKRDAKDSGGRIQTSRNRSADSLVAKRNAMGQDRALRIAMDSKDATGGISYSDMAARIMGGSPRPRQGNSSQMATDNRARQLRDYGSHSASDFMDSRSFDELFPDASRIKTVVG